MSHRWAVWLAWAITFDEGRKAARDLPPPSPNDLRAHTLDVTVRGDGFPIVAEVAFAPPDDEGGPAPAAAVDADDGAGGGA